MPDLLARWTSHAWRAEIEGWAVGELERHGLRSVGPAEQVRVRFWSTVLRVPTDGGTVWVKEANTGQGFEGPVLHRLAQLDPGAFAAPLAVDEQRCRLLLPDVGPTLRDCGDWREYLPQMLAAFAEVQVRLAEEGVPLRESGLPAWPVRDAASYVEWIAVELARLPEGHPQHLDDDLLRQVLGGLPMLTTWVERLAEVELPDTLQHNDLGRGNATVRGDRFAWFDVGDGFWSHPFAVLQLPLAFATGTWPWGPEPDDARIVRAVDAYLEPWTAFAPASSLRALVAPALRLAQLHRCESWRRLLAHVPHDRLGVPTPPLGEHLLQSVQAG